MSDRLPKPKRVRKKRTLPQKQPFAQPQLSFMDPWVADDLPPQPFLVLSSEDCGVSPSSQPPITWQIDSPGGQAKPSHEIPF